MFFSPYFVLTCNIVNVIFIGQNDSVLFHVNVTNTHTHSLIAFQVNSKNSFDEKKKTRRNSLCVYCKFQKEENLFANLPYVYNNDANDKIMHT